MVQIILLNKFSFVHRSDLNIYEKLELESTFIEIIKSRKSNILVGVIYRDPEWILLTSTITSSTSSEKDQSRTKKGVYFGDFNIDLIMMNVN